MLAGKKSYKDTWRLINRDPATHPSSDILRGFLSLSFQGFLSQTRAKISLPVWCIKKVCQQGKFCWTSQSEGWVETGAAACAIVNTLWRLRGRPSRHKSLPRAIHLLSLSPSTSSPCRIEGVLHQISAKLCLVNGPEPTVCQRMTDCRPIKAFTSQQGS